MLARILLISLLGILTFQITASGDAIETARENCTRVESPLAVDVACEVHINCLFYTANVNCSETTLVNLAQSCVNMRIQLCADVATLTMIAIDDAILHFQDMDSTAQLNKSLSAFIEREYQTALDYYENVTLSLDYYPHYILELGLGIIYLRFNNPDVALIQFDKSLNLEFYNPIAFYYRGNTYEQRQNSVRALRDHYMYDLLADDQLKATLPLRSFRIQIQDSELWDLYPIFMLKYGTETFTLRDNTLETAQPIVVSILDNDETLVIADWLDIVAGSETEILFLERDPENPLRYILNVNQQDVPDSVPSGKTEISVIVSPLVLELYLDSTQGMETTLITSIANPITEPDIRENNAKRLCETMPLSLLIVGEELQPLPPQTQIILWDDPAVDDQLAVDLTSNDDTSKNFRVVDDAVCYDNRIWWQVTNGTLTGWLPENKLIPDNEYDVLPVGLFNLWQANPPSPLQFIGYTTIPKDE